MRSFGPIPRRVPGLLMLVALGIALAAPGLRARAADQPPLDLFPNPADYNTFLDLANEGLDELKAKGVAAGEIEAELARKLDAEMPPIIDKTATDPDYIKARTYIIREVMKARGLAPDGGTSPPPLKPSERLLPQDVNIRLFALQEWKKLSADRGLTEEKRQESLLQELLEFAARVCDFPGGDPKDATDDEKAYLSNVVKQVASGGMTAPPDPVQVGLSIPEQQRFRDRVVIRATTLAKDDDPDSPEFLKKLDAAAEEDFRSSLDLPAPAPLTALQRTFLRGTVRQVASTFRFLGKDGKPDGGAGAGAGGTLDPTLRGRLLDLARKLNLGLLQAAASDPNARVFADPEGRRPTLVNFVLGMMAQKQGKANAESLTEAERSEAATIVDEVLRSSPAGSTAPAGPTAPPTLVPTAIGVPGVAPAAPIFLVPVRRHHWFHPRP